MDGWLCHREWDSFGEEGGKETGTGLYPGVGAAADSQPSGRGEVVLLRCMGHPAGNSQREHPFRCSTGGMAVRDWVDSLSGGDAQRGTVTVC